MKKTINGKEYEFIEVDCEDCAFQLHPGCGEPETNCDEFDSEAISYCWKEVKDDSASKDV